MMINLILDFSRRSILGIFLLLLCFISVSQKSQEFKKIDRIGSRPNVLFIIVDDLNTWIGALDGHPNAYTPNIDKLAKEGLLFTNAHCQAPICGPSRASLLTGMFPSTTGIYTQIDDKDIRKDNHFTEDILFLPEYFEEQGYKTLGVGKIFHNGDKTGVFQQYGGFANYGPKPEVRFKYDPAWFGQPDKTQTDWGVYPQSELDMTDNKIAEWAINKLNSNQNTPFFMAVGFIRPHVPLYTVQKWFDLFELDSVKLPNYLENDWNDIPNIAQRIMDMPMMPTTDWAIKNHEFKNITQAYLACIASTDFQIGRVLNALENSVYAENTLVVLTSDHGYHVGEKNRFTKHSLWERSTHVPLIFKGPDIPQNKKINVPVGLIDIYPTLVEYCNFPINSYNEGKSILPLIESPDTNRVALTTYGKNNHSIYYRNWHYIGYEDGSEELYDLKNDPDEFENLIFMNDDFQEQRSFLKSNFPNLNSDEAPGSKLPVNEYWISKQSRQQISR